MLGAAVGAFATDVLKFTCMAALILCMDGVFLRQLARRTASRFRLSSSFELTSSTPSAVLSLVLLDDILGLQFELVDEEDEDEDEEDDDDDELSNAFNSSGVRWI